MQPMTVQEIAAAVGGIWKNPRADAPNVSAGAGERRGGVPVRPAAGDAAAG